MVMPSRIFNGEKYIRSSIMYDTKKDAENAAKEDRSAGWKVRIQRSSEKLMGKYQYRLYRMKK